MPPISLKAANDMIQEGVNIRSTFNADLRQICQTKANNLAIAYTSNDFNAFIFSKDEILRFFKDDLHNPQGKKIDAATHLIVVVGAQIENGMAGRQSFKAGELTVISAGVNKLADDNYVCLDLDEPPGNEHTPKMAISQLQAAQGGGNDILNFKITQ